MPDLLSSAVLQRRFPPESVVEAHKKKDIAVSFKILFFRFEGAYFFPCVSAYRYLKISVLHLKPRLARLP